MVYLRRSRICHCTCVDVYANNWVPTYRPFSLSSCFLRAGFLSWAQGFGNSFVGNSDCFVRHLIQLLSNLDCHADYESFLPAS